MDFANLATRYQGRVATQYEEARAGRKWSAENQAVEQLLKHVALGAKVLDVPVGTGRLLPFLHARNAHVHGLDVSSDMIALAQASADAIGTPAQLGIGDIRQIPFEDASFDLVTCLRFLNWIDTAYLQQVVGELARVSRGKLLLGVRYLPRFGELAQNRQAAVRLAMRTAGIARFLASRSGLINHRKSAIEQLFDSLHLKIADARVVERRCDGTDYVFFLLQKR
ncbi:class I SAM-dependent methyltransferase [Sphingobium mellinum]|uniref:class I SAM-dependent methyltransferase n=1 Tax=Sphingobium mellinum TaxID=1387166 RepID=UPI0030EE680D